MLESPDILKAFEPSKAESFLKEIEGKDPIFVCTIATTETAKIKGISAAGKDPEFTDYTPPADMEYLYYGRCRCIDGVPVTPDGIPKDQASSSLPRYRRAARHGHQNRPGRQQCLLDI
jgi:NaMN:DMB phosphoribosyltransferase